MNYYLKLDDVFPFDAEKLYGPFVNREQAIIFAKFYYGDSPNEIGKIQVLCGELSVVEEINEGIVPEAQRIVHDSNFQKCCGYVMLPIFEDNMLLCRKCGCGTNMFKE